LGAGDDGALPIGFFFDVELVRTGDACADDVVSCSARACFSFSRCRATR
jgi:hypothetical protein